MKNNSETCIIDLEQKRKQEEIQIAIKKPNKKLIQNLIELEYKEFRKLGLEKDLIEFELDNITRIQIRNLFNVDDIYIDEIIAKVVESNKLGVEFYFNNRGNIGIDYSALAKRIVAENNIKRFKNNETKEVFIGRYNNGIYEEDIAIEDIIARYLYEIDEIKEKARHVKKIKDEIQLALGDSITKNITNYIIPEYQLNFKNGIYDVKQKNLEPHSPEKLYFVQINANYNPEAKCPKFMNFIETAFKGREDTIPVLQEALGYALIPRNLTKSLYFFEGVKDAGKSVLLDVLERLIGEKNTFNATPQELAEEGFILVETKNKLLVMGKDCKFQYIKETGRLKNITGDKRTTSNKKGSSYEQFAVTYSCYFACNTMLHFSERDTAFLERLVVFEMLNAIPKSQQNPYLVDELIAEEADGIIQWMLEGVDRLIQNKMKHTESKSISDYRANILFKTDNVVRFVLSNYVVIPSEEISLQECTPITKKALFKLYREFCIENDDKNVPQSTFEDIIKNKLKNVIFIKESKNHLTCKGKMRVRDSYVNLVPKDIYKDLKDFEPVDEGDCPF